MSEKAQQFQDFLFVLIVITEFMVIKADYGMYVNFIGDKCYIFLLSYILPKY